MNQSVLDDPEYLLRCAHTHNWENLIHACERLVVSLRNPCTPTEIVEKSILQIQAVDQWRNNALHAACFNNPPVEVVDALLLVAFVVPRDPVQLHLQRARDGSTPLQIACGCGSSFSVVKSILTHPAIMLDEKDLRRANNDDQWIDGGHSVCTADKMGGTPFTDLLSHYELTRLTKCSSGSSGPIYCPSLDILADVSEVSSFDFLQEFWDKLKCLMQAAWRATAKVSREVVLVPKGSTMPTMVHGLANAAIACPPPLIRCLGRLCRQDFSVLKHNNNNCASPLHIAVARKRSPNSVFVHRHECFIRMALDCQPKAAATVMPFTQRTPLLQAIVSGYDWHVDDKSNSTEKDKAFVDKAGCVQLLYRKHPAAITMGDPVTRQPLFWILAQRRLEKSAERALLTLDTLYHIIRLHPGALWEAK